MMMIVPCHYHHHREKHVAQKRLWSKSKHSEQGHVLQEMNANSEIATRIITIIIIAICRLQDCQPVTDPTLAGEDADDAIWTIPRGQDSGILCRTICN